jgi:hypothetical protein
MSRSRSASSPLALVLFVGAFTLFNAVITSFVLIVPALKWKAAQRWIETPCVVEESKINRTSSSGGGRTGSHLSISYAYIFNASPYRSDRYSIMSGFITGSLGMKSVIARNPVGTQTVCYVNPSNPTEALMNRALTPFMLFGLLPLLFALTGLLWFTAFALQRLKRN